MAQKKNKKLIKNLYRLPDYCSIFQAEYMAIWKAVQFLLSGEIFSGNIMIHFDSQAASKWCTFFLGAEFQMKSRVIQW